MNIKNCKPVYRALLAAREISLGAFMSACNRISGIEKTKVAFSSFKGAAYSDSPKAIAEYLHALRPDIDIVFQLREGAHHPDWVRISRPSSFGWLKEISTAKVIVDNFNRPFYQKKFVGQRYVQTWHGDRGFKKVLYDKDPSGGYPDYKYMDLAVAGSDFCESMYRTAFRYKGEVMKLGLPRNDCLVNGNDVTGLKQKLGVPENAKVMLYAPTFRDSSRGGKFAPDFDIEKVVTALSDITGEKWVCVSRSHSENSGVASSVIDVTDYPEMSDIMLMSDMLITDFSSCAGDFPLTGKPVILYISDRPAEREMYFDIDMSPYNVAHSEDELYELFKDIRLAKENGEDILRFFGTNETGRSAEEVAKCIIKWIEE